MSEPEQDQELIDLLSSLTPQKTITLDTSNPNPPPKVEEPEPEPEPEPAETEDIDAPPPPVVKPEIVEPELIPAIPPTPVTPPPPTDLVTTAKPPQESAQFKQLLGIFQNSIEIIVNNHTADRNQVEEAIKYYNDQVRQGQGGKSFVEGLAKLLEIKAEINANATNVLDSISKLLAAGKGNDLIINIQNKSGEVDLEALLAQPKKEDEK